MSQTMLLTKRLTTFLSQNTTPLLPSLLLLSPTGKLLSSSSPLPASTLRTQATLACSLWTLYQPTTSILPNALPLHHPSHNQNGSRNGNGSQSHSRGSDATFSSTSTITDHDLSTITIQLTHGVMVIRALSCGLLFVAIGPSNTSTANSTSNPQNSGPNPGQQTLQAQAHASSSRPTSPPSSPPPPPAHGDTHDGDSQSQVQSQVQSPAQSQREFGNHLAVGSAAPSDAGSIRSTGTRGGSIVSLKRQAVEVGRWLDGQLEGFRLCPPEAR
ncbi:uncharacterized protein RSE6_00051 [Rhynchosporium secalis]|uniref:Uncharacterized protein n=1 Tax=Rhynchosporium secalis TaxID=38038 RepID=A0A1E1LUG0_RHYSE|nr:uncharacterized protein RSE6_00051 [Rhynchosporium secalis]